MKNLMNSAVEELMVRVENEINEMKVELKVTVSVKGKLNIINKRKETITKLLNRIKYLRTQMEVRYPDDKAGLTKIDKYVYKKEIQLLDEFYKANRCY